MSIQQLAEGEFKPLHEAHSIEQVVFHIKFSNPIDDQLFNNIKGMCREKYIDKLPAYVEMQDVAVTIGAGMPFTPSAPAISGFLMRLIAPNGVVETELVFEKGAITYRTLKYSRWKTIWNTALEVFNDLLPRVVASTQLSQLVLNYIDRYYWNGKPEAADIGKLLNPNSKYLASHIFSTQDFWHVHTGTFVRGSEQTRRLLNANVDFAERRNSSGEIRPIVTVATILTDSFIPDSKQLKMTSDNVVELVDRCFEDMHEVSKATLKDIITDRMSALIALN